MANITAAGDGITGGYMGSSLGLKITIATLAGVTWYNAFELVVLIFVTFAQYRGLYFWSLLISSSVGLIPYSLGFLLKFFHLTDATWLPVTFLTVGWWCMVTGQSIVLYSRLHLVLSNHRILRRVLTMILVDAVVLHLPTTVLTFGSNLAPANARQPYINGYNVMEKIQMTGFCIQEFVISGLYIWETVRMIRLDPDRTKRKIQYQLIIINLVIIGMDLGLLVAEFKNFYIMETMLKGAVYSIKLKLEFAVLGKLIHLVHNHVWKAESFSGPSELPDFVDATRVTSDLTHAAPTITRDRGPSWMDADDVSIAMFEHSPSVDANGVPSDISNSWSSETRINHGDHITIDFINPFCRYQSWQSRSSRLPDTPEKHG
ncbi:hypothetical protein N7448_003696 [Penicillium atrosanguineum]|uniref:DUF7703 domain-containing protein n=1 Tax=Penicillium atrosanguineum TaxID=1132637 RepID=A0A9W9H8C4_9EURO|nr:uncharacterized protein N7443_002664 [Penicillium atrosanguineum]KAJ5140288.1 hypothetical protein N7448_003696 [Penicillium atrosanguineum]KAJ5310203.1 hypothetical protein N7443_002664 [Penicillium atrosanguineum]KAJ5315720.1 hypothetical protein N7476_006027 [Penicillium atrosanguineum]